MWKHRNIMRIIVKAIFAIASAAAVSACGPKKETAENFKYTVDQFADIKVMRSRLPGWESLSLKQKEYAYHLAEAAKYGRDITWDQYCRWNLPVRHLLENIIENYKGDRKSEYYKNFEIYAK